MHGHPSAGRLDGDEMFYPKTMFEEIKTRLEELMRTCYLLQEVKGAETHYANRKSKISLIKTLLKIDYFSSKFADSW